MEFSDISTRQELIKRKQHEMIVKLRRSELSRLTLEHAKAAEVRLEKRSSAVSIIQKQWRKYFSKVSNRSVNLTATVSANDELESDRKLLLMLHQRIDLKRSQDSPVSATKLKGQNPEKTPTKIKTDFHRISSPLLSPTKVLTSPNRMLDPSSACKSYVESFEGKLKANTKIKPKESKEINEFKASTNESPVSVFFSNSFKEKCRSASVTARRPKTQPNTPLSDGKPRFNTPTARTTRNSVPTMKITPQKMYNEHDMILKPSDSVQFRTPLSAQSVVRDQHKESIVKSNERAQRMLKIENLVHSLDNICVNISQRDLLRSSCFSRNISSPVCSTEQTQNSVGNVTESVGEIESVNSEGVLEKPFVSVTIHDSGSNSSVHPTGSPAPSPARSVSHTPAKETTTKPNTISPVRDGIRKAKINLDSALCAVSSMPDIAVLNGNYTELKDDWQRFVDDIELASYVGTESDVELQLNRFKASFVAKNKKDMRTKDVDFGKIEKSSDTQLAINAAMSRLMFDKPKISLKLPPKESSTCNDANL